MANDEQKILGCRWRERRRTSSLDGGVGILGRSPPIGEKVCTSGAASGLEEGFGKHFLYADRTLKHG